MADIDRKIIQERNLDILVANKGFAFTNTFFPYTSGQIGPYYIQSGVVMNNGKDYVSAVGDMTILILDTIRLHEVDVISGGETRDWIFSGPVSNKLQKPHAMLYKNGKTVGAPISEANVVNVADLNNEGSSIRDYWVPIIKKSGGKISDVFFYVDRMEDGVQVVKDAGLRSHAAVRLNEHAWDYLKSKDIVNKAIYKNLQARMENKDAWAENMLRSDAGISTLKKIFMDENTLAKGQKILRIGYPQLKNELEDKLKKSGVPLELLIYSVP